MKLLTTISAALFFTCSFALQSKPFNLILHSDNSTLDGKALLSGHEGAAIEGLLPYDLKNAHNGAAVYGFNSTSNQPNYGILTWVLPANGGSLHVSQGMDVYSEPSTNVGVALFGAGDGYFYVSFDSNNYMYVQSFYDDCTNPPTHTTKAIHLDRWYICFINYLGYNYNQLSWVYGHDDPQNPTCQKVSVERVFVK